MLFWNKILGGHPMDQQSTTPPSKDDVLAILKAHRDLGPEYDSHLADQIMELWPNSPRSRERMRVRGEVRSPRRNRSIASF